MREAPPPYAGEGPHALWHVSEDDSIRWFEPRDGKVWAIAPRLLPLYWFPRECPRATFWAESTTTDGDIDRFLGADRACRVHVVEPEWLESMRRTRVLAYRMRHEQASIELDTEPHLLRFWDEVVGASLGFSGIRLRNARMR